MSKYTKEQLRHIDALIAEHVMCLPVTHTDRIKAEEYDWFVQDGKETRVPNYSTHISAAWGIVDRLRKTGLTVSIDCLTISTIVDIYVEETDTCLALCVENSTPLAICLAALQFKEVDTEKELNK